MKKRKKQTSGVHQNSAYNEVVQVVRSEKKRAFTSFTSLVSARIDILSADDNIQRKNAPITDPCGNPVSFSF